MKKSLLFISLLFVTVVGVVFAENNICKVYTNNNGLSVFVESKKDPKDKDLSVQDYLNVITIASNGNKMRIIDCQIRSGNKWKSVSKPLGKILEPYGDYKFEWKSSFNGLKRDDIKVTAEGCN